jgi:hypothetical protein
MKLRSACGLWLLLGATVLVGCGDEGGDDEADDMGTGGALGSGGGPTGTGGSTSVGTGTGGSTGTGGATGTGGTGTGGSAATPVPCGSMTCTPPAFGMGFIGACCADSAAGTCGMAFMGGQCAAPAEPDPRCDSIDIMGIFMLASCCTTDGQCGIDAAPFMPGCISLAEAEMQAMMMGMGIPVTFPEPRACDDPGGADAGN